MSDFEVKVVRINDVYDHPNADRLSIVKIGGYECVSGKMDDGSPRYKAGDLVVYVPEDALLPEYLLKSQGFWNEGGTLSGAGGNRVKAVRLRGVVSQGILIGVTHFHIVTNESGEALGVREGDDVAEFLGIKKYEPGIPANMAGSVTRAPHPGAAGLSGNIIVKYDFENIKKNHDIFEDGELVYLTEKLHGTFCQIGYIPGMEHEEGFGSWYVASKGLGKQGLCFQNVASNLYTNVLKGFLNSEVSNRVLELSSRFHNAPIRIFGEIFGKGVQDLDYGFESAEFRMFDILIRENHWANYIQMEALEKDLLIERVPVLAVAPYSEAFVNEHRDGKTTLGAKHTREGVVIRSYNELTHPKYGRRIAKAISPEYLLRKNATEYT